MQPADRFLFSDSFQKLTKKGCREDVLFQCLYIFLNSLQVGVAFPWSEDFEPIQNALSKTREVIQKVMNSPGFKTLEASRLEPSLATFADFVSAQRGFLKRAAEYESELQFVLQGLPRKDIVRQYGRAVICMYVRAVLRRPAISLIEDLLRCFRKSDQESNLARDLKDFQKKQPSFFEHAEEFLSIEHDSARKPLALDWPQFCRTGRL